MIEPRIYRAAFLPALLALVLVMFSLESRPPALPQGLAADVLFDGQRANAELREIVRGVPNRRPGSAGNQRTAERVARELAALGFRTELDRFEAEDTRLVNVLARRGGGSSSQIVVIAARDASRIPDATSSAADTAALVELARVLQGKVARKALLLASVDGSTLGDAGVRRLAEQLDEGPAIDGVIVLSHFGARRADGPMLVSWSNNHKRGGIGLLRTATNSLRQELPGRVSAGSHPVEQATRLAFPLGVGGQGPLLARGFDAIRISASGELPPPDEGRPDDLDLDRYEALGRGALRTVFALEEGGKPKHGPNTYVIFAGQVMPGWVMSLLGLCLIIPALVASVDAFARARRRRAPVGPYLSWLGAAVLAFVAALLLAELLVLIGQAPDPPPGPPMPDAGELDGQAIAALIVTSFAMALGLLLARTRALRRPDWPPPAGEPGAGCVVALAMSFTLLLVWFANPYTALLLAPALHIWLIVCLTNVRARVGVSVVLLGLLPVAIAALIYLSALNLNPLEGAWYLFQLVTGGQVGFVAALLGCALLGIFVSALGVAAAHRGEPEDTARDPAARRRRRDEDAPAIFGPGGHAGPGMLGGPTGARRR